MCFLHELLDYGEYPFTEHKTDELACDQQLYRRRDNTIQSVHAWDP